MKQQIKQEPSFRIENTTAETKERIERLYQESVARKSFLTDYWAKALFYYPDLINGLTFCIAAEIGYQRAVKELTDDIMQLAV